VLVGIPDAAGIAIGGSIVCSTRAGGMWSITLTTLPSSSSRPSVFLLILVPVAVSAAGGFDGLHARLNPSYFDFGGIGGATSWPTW